ncbi:MAG: PHP domain-containing protein [Kistimonas sp.]|nr:PHP domain-containing protein [Kistimonas sp.]
MSQKVDFHCHSTASDGALSPLQVLSRAAEQGVSCLALTDHDTLAGTRWLQKKAQSFPVRLVPGCEISCTWGRKEIHVLALAMDLDHPPVTAFIDRQIEARRQRSHAIAARLAARLPQYSADQCLGGAREEAWKAQRDADADFVLPEEQLQIGRPHFAAWMQREALVPDRRTAFERYLKNRQLGGIEHHWRSMQETVAAIDSWNAMAVLAHPHRYRLTATQLRALIKDFVAAGGQGLEVVTCRQAPGERERLGALCQQFDLYGSMGSDFHAPVSEYVELGRLAPLPAGCPCVMSQLQERNLL